PDEMSIVLNTPFSMIRTINKQQLKRVDYFSSAGALNAVYDPHYKGRAGGRFKNENIVIIILESFGLENSALLNPGLRDIDPEGYAPFLDSLMQQSRTYRNSFANGLKSIDSLPSILASIPSLELPYVLSQHSHNRINSIAGLLRARGYATSYFHGAPNGSMGFQAFVHLAGFDKYYGRTEYGNDDDYDGIWGIWDEEFFQFFANTLNKEKQPFCTAISSVSSHHPFKVPQRYEGKFREGPAPLNKAISYTDYALKRFFETASKMPWYENTLFVITADHASYNFQDFKNSRGNFAVPLIFFKPGGGLKGFDDTVVQQIDIMPTVLNYLNFDGEYIAFGNNAFDGSADHFAVNYTADTYQIFMSDHLLQFRDEKVVGFYNFRNDRLLKNNMVDELPEVRKQLETKLRAFIQQYNNRMLDNDITVRGPKAIAAKAE
ncbi:MAG: LTA synthase family protein, partial [Nitrospirota bacterium]|nr:LTA synthase family protein [Nitrospirota bacterium]